MMRKLIIFLILFILIFQVTAVSAYDSVSASGEGESNKIIDDIVAHFKQIISFFSSEREQDVQPEVETVPTNEPDISEEESEESTDVPPESGDQQETDVPTPDEGENEDYGNNDNQPSNSEGCSANQAKVRKRSSGVSCVNADKCSYECAECKSGVLIGVFTGNNYGRSECGGDKAQRLENGARYPGYVYTCVGNTLEVSECEYGCGKSGSTPKCFDVSPAYSCYNFEDDRHYYAFGFKSRDYNYCSVENFLVKFSCTRDPDNKYGVTRQGGEGKFPCEYGCRKGQCMQGPLECRGGDLFDTATGLEVPPFCTDDEFVSCVGGEVYRQNCEEGCGAKPIYLDKSDNINTRLNDIGCYGVDPTLGNCEEVGEKSDPLIKGTTYFMGLEAQLQDECDENAVDVVLESFCDEGRAVRRPVVCPDSHPVCREGACVKE